jgi:dipeptidyl-peptidase-4
MVKPLTQGVSQSIRNGKADWIYYEEILGRSWRAFRWSPDSRKLVFQQFDDRTVSSFSVSSHVNVQPTFETEFYP